MKEMKWHTPPTTSDKWNNMNVVAGVLDGTYGFDFPGVVVDIGANVGSFAVLAAEKATKVYAYEPAAINYQCLLENIEESGYTNIVPYQYAVGTPGTRFLNTNTINCGSFSMFKSSKHPSGQEEIQCISLEQVFTDNNLTHVDWLKIDCEGGEWEFLLNNPLVSKVDHIRMELHNDLPDGKPEWTQDAMINFLKESGFTVKTIKAYTPTCITIWADK